MSRLSLHTLARMDRADLERLNLLEQDFQRLVVAHARARGWLVYHTKNSKGSPKGFPDLVMGKDGHAVFAELKREKGDNTLTARVEQQSAWGQAVGGHLWRPRDAAYIIRVLG